ncbi:MAG: polysaccharide deacetylase family protein [Clostridia bacterium]|nr:polysaccharide deacetylase family protein [Clostridia bacterium]
MKRHLFAFSALLLALLLLLTGCGGGDLTAATTAGGENAAQATDALTAAVPETATTTAAATANPKTEKLIALTFDDGPNAATTNRILDALEQNGAKATFFVCGYCLGEKGAQVVKRQIALGCEIGNHTKDHKTLTKLSASSIATQVGYVNDRVKEIAGYDVKLLRAPGGAYKGVLDQVDMPFIQWSIDTNDWRWKDEAHKDRTDAERSAKLEEIKDFVLDSAEPGAIVLMHDIYDFSADLAGMVIPALIAKGYKLVTVSEMYQRYGEQLKPSTIYFNIDVSPANADSGEPLPVGTYTVNTKNDPLNMRTEAKQSADVVTKIPKGATVTVTDAVPGWAYVTYESQTGWVSAKYLRAAA